MPAVAALPVESNRRAAVRRQPALGTVCHLGELAELGLVWNVSTTGVSMLLHDPIQPHEKVAAQLSTLDGRGKLAIGLNVVHLRQLRTGDYFLGAQFERTLAPEELHPFLADHAA